MDRVHVGGQRRKRSKRKHRRGAVTSTAFALLGLLLRNKPPSFRLEFASRKIVWVRCRIGRGVKPHNGAGPPSWQLERDHVGLAPGNLQQEVKDGAATGLGFKRGDLKIWNGMPAGNFVDVPKASPFQPCRLRAQRMEFAKKNGAKTGERGHQQQQQQQ